MADSSVFSGSFLVCLLLATQATAYFNPLQRLGGQSPYFPAPAQYGVSADVPSGCTVDQAAYLLRHGSRYPTNGSYNGWVTLYNKLQNATFTAKGPLDFLPTWSPPLDDPEHQVEMLSGTGTLEAFQLGVQLKRLKLTKPGTPLTVWSASQQRCVDTAQWFLQGYNSAGHYDVAALGKIVSMADSVNYTFANSLTSTNSCPRYVTNETYANNYRDQLRIPIAARLNKDLKGLTLTPGDVGTMMDLCGFQTEVAGFSPFCDVFTKDEWEDFEYAMDLQYYYGSGPGNPYSATTFWPYLKAVTDLFAVGPGKTTASSDSTFIPPALLMSFSHDNDLTPLISALGIFNESSYSPLHPIKPNSSRKFRASYAITFGGRVALERMTCASKGAFVRVRVNDAVVPLKDCTSGPGHSCGLKDFVRYVDRRGQVAGDFVKTCGQSAPNATSLFTAFIDPAAVL